MSSILLMLMLRLMKRLILRKIQTRQVFSTEKSRSYVDGILCLEFISYFHICCSSSYCLTSKLDGHVVEIALQICFKPTTYLVFSSTENVELL